MRTIELTRGKVALVDDEDYDLVAGHSWYAVGTGRHVYAVRNDGKSRLILHRYLLDAPPGLVVYHLNGDGLDCRRCNLRLTTHTVVQRHRRAGRRNRTSRFRGLIRVGPSWRAFIRHGGTTTGLGTYRTEEEAARAYDAAVVLYRGGDGRMNFPPNIETTPEKQDG